MRKNTLWVTLFLLTAFILIAPNPAQTSDTFSEGNNLSIETEKQRSADAIKDFAGRLQAKLKKALQKGGAVNAITVCNSEAVLIAQDVSQKRNLSITRVSLKNRNPANAPNEWQEKVLEEFESRKSKGEHVSELTYIDIAEIGTKKQFRFMKAIPTGPICIKCHGPDIADEVKNRLDELYPDDKARGFRPGDIRGAFVVINDVSP